MASGEIDVTPGRVLSSTEVLDNAKLNDLGRPILRVKEAAITSRELAPGSIDSDKLNVDLEAQIGVADGSVTTAKIVDGAVTSAKLSSDAAIPVGSVLDFAGATAPTGWLLCYGQAISRSTYSALFTAIGTAHGVGDGSSTFNLPDMRGRVAAGKDDMGGVSASRFHPSWAVAPYNTEVTGTTLGSAGGHALNQLTVANLASHGHSASGAAQINTNNVENGNYGLASINTGVPGGVGFNGRVMLNRANFEWGVAVNVAAAGSSQHHNNTQPTIILNKIIKAI